MQQSSDMNQMQMTLEQWMPEIFLMPTAGASEAHAQASAKQEEEKDLMAHLASLKKSSGSYGTKNLQIDPSGYSMKMLKECFQAIEDGTLPSFSLKWTSWGSIVNGSCLTQKISEFRKTENESTLSDVLVTGPVDQKYFLLEKTLSALKLLDDVTVEDLILPTHTHTHNCGYTDSVGEHVTEKDLRTIESRLLHCRRQADSVQRLPQKVIQVAMMKSKRNNPNQYRIYSARGIAPCLNKAEGGGRVPYVVTGNGSRS